MSTARIFLETEELLLPDAILSSALTEIFRGRLCQTILEGKKPISFPKEKALFEVGDKERTLFFIERGFVKVGTISEAGNEIIFDVRKDGDVAGELSVCKAIRPDRAVALEPTQAYSIEYSELMASLQKNRELLSKLMETFCDALSSAYEQILTLTTHETLPRVANALIGLAKKMGHAEGSAVRIPAYITQEEIAQMVAARRERVSTALNSLRRQGMVQYSKHGHLVVRLDDLIKHFAV